MVPIWTRFGETSRRCGPGLLWAGLRVVTEEMLTDLPEPVRRYLRYTGVVGRPFPGTLRLHEKGRMRLQPGQPWMPLDAEEHYSAQPLGFVWAGTVRLGPLPAGRAGSEAHRRVP